jgi:ABC-2 type transport system permease protein
MRNVLAIARREILSFFVSPVAYFVITGFVLLAGWFFFQYMVRFNLVLAYFTAMQSRGMGGALPSLNDQVIELFYQSIVFLLIFLVPVLTMRLIAEEKKSVTFELLATSPLSIGQIVTGKFLGVGFVLLVMCLLLSAFPMLLVFYMRPGPEVLPILSGLLAILLAGLAFASIGMACSAFTENQVVGAISGVVALLLLSLIYSPGSDPNGFNEVVLRRLSPLVQLQDLVKGVITTDSLVYFLSLISLGLFLSKRALEAQRWR